MKLETNSKVVNIVLKTRKIVDIANVLKNKKFEEAFFTAVRECDLEALSKILYILGENEEGKAAFKNSNEVYDFLDEYMKENNKSYTEIYNDLANTINEEGFFKSKMTEEVLQARIHDIMSSVNYEDIIKKSVEKVATEAVTEEFKGFNA